MVHIYRNSFVGIALAAAAMLAGQFHKDMGAEQTYQAYIVPAYTIQSHVSDYNPLSEIGNEIRYVSSELMKNRPLDKSDRYYSLSKERQQTVKELIENRLDPDALMDICVDAMKISNKEHGIPEQDAEGYTECGRCAAFAETMAQYLGNKIPSYSGDAWTIYRRNPEFRKYQIYPDDIDKWSVSELNNGIGPVVPEDSTDNPKLSTGDIATTPWPGAKQHVYHAGVIIRDPATSDSYFLETRGIIGMNPISGGNVDIDGNLLPIAEVIGSTR